MIVHTNKVSYGDRNAVRCQKQQTKERRQTSWLTNWNILSKSTVLKTYFLVGEHDDDLLPTRPASGDGGGRHQFDASGRQAVVLPEQGGDGGEGDNPGGKQGGPGEEQEGEDGCWERACHEILYQVY